MPAWLSSEWMSWVFWILAGVIAVAGVWLLYAALLRDRSRGRRRCPKCWYEMTGVPGLRCPECGREARSERKLFRSRRYRWRAAGAVGLLLIAMATAWTPEVMRVGFYRAVPSAGLLLADWLLDLPEDGKVMVEIRERFDPNARGSWRPIVRENTFTRWVAVRWSRAVLERCEAVSDTSASTVRDRFGRRIPRYQRIDVAFQMLTSLGREAVAANAVLIRWARAGYPDLQTRLPWEVLFAERLRDPDFRKLLIDAASVPERSSAEFRPKDP